MGKGGGSVLECCVLCTSPVESRNRPVVKVFFEQGVVIGVVKYERPSSEVSVWMERMMVSTKALCLIGQASQ